MMSKGFSLIELMIIVAIIGIISMVSLPFYRLYAFRVEQSKMFNDLVIVAKNIQTNLAAGNFEGEYSATSLMNLAPDYRLESSYCSTIPGYKTARLQWSNPESIRKILNSGNSKILSLDIETYFADAACKGDPNSSIKRQTFIIVPDYNAYKIPLKTNTGAARIALVMGPDIDILDKDGKVIHKTSDSTEMYCYTHVSFTKVPPEVPISGVPTQCRNIGEYGSSGRVKAIMPY